MLAQANAYNRETVKKSSPKGELFRFNDKTAVLEIHREPIIDKPLRKTLQVRAWSHAEGSA